MKVKHTYCFSKNTGVEGEKEKAMYKREMDVSSEDKEIESSPAGSPVERLDIDQTL
jgi:hypothetical protein